MDREQRAAGEYRKILFCTDFSENARSAFAYALHAARLNPTATLYLLHVIPEPDAQFWRGYIYEVGDMDAKARADIDQKIDADYRPLVPEGVPFEVVMQIGDAAQGILDYAEANQIDLIVMGKQGRGALTQWLLGNVAGKVVRKAYCPVLVIPPAE
ncbi:MAG: universal stress protein [Kiritimatiellae bacterium]|nr:universal stress protein [Kiritimatiellia bacterium]